MNSEKILTIHAGLHKTGTTSIQKYLADQAGFLAKRGVVYDISKKFSQNGLNHNKITSNLGVTTQLLGDSTYHVIVSSEDILLEIGNLSLLDSPIRESFLGDIESAFDRIVFAITLPPSFDIIARRIIYQQLRSHASCYYDFLRNYLQNYLLSIRDTLKQLQNSSFSLQLIRPQICSNTGTQDILVPFLRSVVPFCLEEDSIEKPVTLFVRENKTFKEDFAKDVLFGFARQAIVDSQENVDSLSWWSIETQRSTELVFEDFLLMGDNFKKRFEDVVNLLVDKIIIDPMVTDLIVELDSTYLG